MCMSVILLVLSNVVDVWITIVKASTAWLSVVECIKYSTQGGQEDGNVKYLARGRTSISCCQTLPSSFSADLRICITAQHQALHFSEVFKKTEVFSKSSMPNTVSGMWSQFRTESRRKSISWRWNMRQYWPSIVKLVWPVNGIWYIYQV